MKKIAIKKLLVAVAIATATNNSFAQTPYDSFAPSSEKKEMLKLPETTFRAYNTDTTSESRYIELDKEMYTISYFNENDSLLKTVQLEPTAMKWYSVDPHASNYPEASPYNFVNNNPILNIDPDGRDWFRYVREGSDEASWNWHVGSTYEHKTGVDADGNDVFETLQGYQAVMVFNGSNGEQLGAGNNLYGEGAKLASVTIYGPQGADDIQTYEGYTMSSDPTKYGVIKSNDESNPYYVGNYDAAGKSGVLKSWWTINGRGAVPTMQDVNPYKPNQIDANGQAYLTGIFVHRSNKDGYCGGGVSKGCPIIAPGRNKDAADWYRLKQQMGGHLNIYNINQFAIQIIR